MKITHLTETEEAWPYFYDFCIQSKPYDFCNLPSRHLRDHEIRRAFEDFKTCEIYTSNHDGKTVGFAFLYVEDDCIDVSFLFGVRRNFTSIKLIEATHAAFDMALKDHNKNYLKSQIRRNFKFKSFKKWIERYDKRAIIFNDDDNTVVWCNKEYMTKDLRFKVVGANKTTHHLMGRECLLTGGSFPVCHSIVRELSFDGKKYLLDEKNIDFLPDRVVINGYLSDNEQNVGRVALEFIPQQ